MPEEKLKRSGSTAVVCLVIFVCSLFALFAAAVFYRHGLVCVSQQVEKIVVVKTCVGEWIGFGGRCWYFSEVEKNWTEAQRACNAWNSSLAVIHNETQFLLRYKGETEHWVGLRKTPVGYQWVDGTLLNATVHGLGEADCVYLSQQYFTASRCHIPTKFICVKQIW